MNSNGYRTAVRFLERYGLTGDNATTDFLADGAPNLNDIRDTDVISNKALRYGLLRFTNEAIFTPNRTTFQSGHRLRLALCSSN